MDLEEIIEGCKKGKPKAQKALYDMFSKRLFGVCLRYCRCREDAQDVFQEAFVKVFNKIDKYESFGSFEGWLRKIFINNALNYYRYDKRQFQISNDDIDIPNDDNENDAYLDNYSTNMILDAIQKLTNQQRIIFNMIEVEGESYEEVAKLLDVSQECIRSHNCKAKKILRSILFDLYTDK